MPSFIYKSVLIASLFAGAAFAQTASTSTKTSPSNTQSGGVQSGGTQSGGAQAGTNNPGERIITITYDGGTRSSPDLRYGPYVYEHPKKTASKRRFQIWRFLRSAESCARPKMC